MAIVTKSRPLLPAQSAFVHSRLAQIKQQRIQWDATAKTKPVPQLQGKLAIAYLYPALGSQFDDLALRFVRTYSASPPGIEHDTVIITNGGNLTPKMRNNIEGPGVLPNIRYIERISNDGFDIGAFQHAANYLDCYACCFFGAPAHFKRAGWLKRLVDAWQKHGPGMYGSMASFLQRPHLQTTGFLTSPEFIRKWGPLAVSRADRYAFEWGWDALWRKVVAWGYPAMLVTWDGEYNPRDWRKPKNCLWRGDQSNCLSYFRHSDTYDNESVQQRQLMSRYADGLENNSPDQVRSRQAIEGHRYKYSPKFQFGRP